ncbi:oxygenase MpaB family protein [Pandoraea cepalis]|uniref:oxygenase MpaB family protein n=1 Tax=Pandoraea cepalis TaxID=2508294 RepID=UPI00263AE319|nr:hypothetical protein [Pandoraea cepalis]
MSYKWIAKRIDALDEEQDCDEIWKLMSAYRANDFVMNLIYAVTFPHFIISEFGAKVLLDGGKGKIIRAADRRADDTSWKMQTWWHYGSSHEETKRNVESINRTHAFYAKKYPDEGPDTFGDDDIYMYTLCYEAAGMHRLLQRVGLRGYSEKEKRVAVRFWTKMTGLFINVKANKPVSGYPKTFEDVMAFMDKYESRDLDGEHPLGIEAVRHVIGQFGNRYFPRSLRWFARLWVISLLPDWMLGVYKITAPNRLVIKLFRFGTAAFFWVGDRLAPDPKDTFIERRDMRLVACGAGSLSDPRREVGSVGACPFHMRAERKKSSAEAGYEDRQDPL